MMPKIQLLAFEIASLMSKLVNLWQSLSDKQAARLREEITNSVGIKKLVSDDESFIFGLICEEMLNILVHVAESVDIFAMRCSNINLRYFQYVFKGPVHNGDVPNPYGWQFTWKKMEKEVKKMEKLISINASLYQELEVLDDLDQTFRRIHINGESDGINLTDCRKKLRRKRQEVKNLKKLCSWNWTYDYTIHLLCRSSITIFSRIYHLFGTNKSGKFEKSHGHSTIINEKRTNTRHSRLTQVGLWKGFMMAAFSSSVTDCYAADSSSVTDCYVSAEDANSFFNAIHSNHFFLKPPPETLGASALALHYANVIIEIEKLAASPHLIGLNARDELYNMLPTTVRTALRARLKPYKMNVALSVYDTVLVEEWSEAMSSILEWLAPLAHNTIRWQSERSFEQQSFVSRTNVWLVQTLYFANQEKIEATIIELLVELNCAWRYVGN